MKPYRLHPQAKSDLLAAGAPMSELEVAGAGLEEAVLAMTDGR